MSSHDRLDALAAAGVSIWLDDLSLELVASAQLEDLIADWNVVGVTTNPTIFAAALSHGETYDAQIRSLLTRGVDVATAVREITVAEVVTACDLFRATFEATDGIDGRVSLEVDPGLARDTDATTGQAIELWETVNRPNLLVKNPATEAGLPAITRAVAQGISINVTLIFSVQRYRAVMQAYLHGLEQAVANGHPLAEIASVTSFFVSRVDTEIDARLTAIGTDEALGLRGRAALANCRLGYAAFQQVFTGPRWEALAARGARVQRPLWASTGTKNPDTPDTRYVSELVVAGTVNTMPAATLRAFADHGHTRGDRVTATPAAAQQVFDDLQRAGIDLTEAFLALENDGLAKFEASWDELGATVQPQLDQAR